MDKKEKMTRLNVQATGVIQSGIMEFTSFKELTVESLEDLYPPVVVMKAQEVKELFSNTHSPTTLHIQLEKPPLKASAPVTSEEPEQA